uniref:Uncharacterized protein n=1 Tax=Rhizophora mucronata TaxID=61149 RepID=A0A2P2PT42_RHIMU
MDIVGSESPSYLGAVSLIGQLRSFGISSSSEIYLRSM